MFITYVLYSELLNKYYIGHTIDMENRLSRHNKGFVRSTKYGCPWIIVYKEEYLTKNDAYKRELKIKSYKKGNAFKKLINI